MKKRIRYCEKCGSRLVITNHYCFTCLRKLRKKPKKEKENLKEKINKELNRIQNAPFSLLLDEYIRTLAERPIFFSESDLSNERFRKLGRQIKFRMSVFGIKFIRLHIKGRFRPEMIIFKESQKPQVKTKLKNIYPNVRLPRIINR